MNKVIFIGFSDQYSMLDIVYDDYNFCIGHIGVVWEAPENDFITKTEKIRKGYKIIYESK